MRFQTHACYLKAPLREVWRIQFDEALLDMPLFWDGMIFLKQPDRTIAAYDERKERRIWEYPQKGWLKDEADGFLYYAGEDENLHVLEAKTGQPITISTCPIQYDAVVQENFLINMGSNSIYAVDPSTGTRVWEYCPEGNPGFSSELSAIGDRVIFGIRDSTLRALSARDGTEIWRHDVSDLRWQNQGESYPPGTAIGRGSILGNSFLIRIAHDYVIACLIETGDRIWTWNSDSVSASVGGSASLYGDRYYATGANGTYHVIDAASGRTLLERQLSESLPKKLKKVWGWLPILVSETHLFVGSHEGHLVAFDRESGEYAWSYYPKGGGGVTRYFVSKNRRLYYADLCFRLYCLEEG